MPNLSPQPPVSATVPSPRPTAPPARPGLLKRHSSTSTPGYSRGMASHAVSPGSHPDSTQPLRHQVRGKHGHHARLVVPRGHGSRTNLAKMGGGRQAQSQLQLQGYEGRPDRHGRQRSHEGDTEIRLPGSLDESAASSRVEAARPQMKRNLTAYQLPRNVSHGKLKKNLSHGALQRLGGKAGGMAAVQQQVLRPPTSPGLRGKSRNRPKSADFGRLDAEREVDLHEQEVELARKLKEGKGKGKGSGFKLGSMGDEETSEEEEEEWTEESASASPYSTRQNTANNSRRASMAKERSTQLEPIAGSRDETAEQDGRHVEDAQKEVQLPPKQVQSQEANEDEEDDEEIEDDEEDDTESDDPASPRSQPHHRPTAPLPDTHPTKPVMSAKEHPNPTASFLRRQSEQHIAPAQVSNITATDTAHTNISSTQLPTPGASQQHLLTHVPRHESQDDGEQTEELISRFIPSTSQPQSVPHSNRTTNASNTPAQSFHQPPNPISPGGSTLSASSGAATPSASTTKGRSRIELKMLSEKALADLEDNATRQPVIPAHVYDRRNESLKSYLNLASLGMGGPDIRIAGPASHFPPASTIPGLSPNQLGTASGNLSLGPEIFQGRFTAVQQELRVVQKFRDPLRESITRLRNCGGSRLNSHPTSGAGKLKQSPTKSSTGLKGSKSAVALPLRSASHGASKSTSQLPPPGGLDGEARPVSRQTTAPKRGSTLQLSTSASPPRTAMKSPVLARDGAVGKRAPSRGVSFAGGEAVVMPQGGGVEEIARRLWEGVGV